jgi:hypothetical protein
MRLKSAQTLKSSPNQSSKKEQYLLSAVVICSFKTAAVMAVSSIHHLQMHHEV